MAKRFTDTSKFKKPFLRSLPKSYKLLWAFICDDCDNAGIWIVDMKAARLYLGCSFKEEVALGLFNADEVRVIPIDNARKWFLPSFIEFQYGELTANCKPHLPVITALKKFGLLDTNLRIAFEKKGYTKGIQTLEEKEQEKDKEKDFGKSENLLPTDHDFNASIARILNKPYEKGAERGTQGTGQDIDSLIIHLQRNLKWDQARIIGAARAMKACYQLQGWTMPTYYPKIIESLTGNDWPAKLKDLDPQRVAENIEQTKNEHRRKPEPDTIGTSPAGSLG